MAIAAPNIHSHIGDPGIPMIAFKHVVFYVFESRILEMECDSVNIFWGLVKSVLEENSDRVPSPGK